MRIDTQVNLLQANQDCAAENRVFFQEKGIFAVNMIASPGAGKTALIESILGLEGCAEEIAVIEGDLATAKDAERIRSSGAQVVQINTDGGCHLDAKMIQRVLPAFDLTKVKFLLIENVGNLVCPSAFDLGEDLRMIVLSVTEGADKPSKYPTTFCKADAVIFNKMDLLPYVDFDLSLAQKDILHLAPQCQFFQTIARLGHDKGMQEIYAYLCAQRNRKMAYGNR